MQEGGREGAGRETGRTNAVWRPWFEFRVFDVASVERRRVKRKEKELTEEGEGQRAGGEER